MRVPNTDRKFGASTDYVFVRIDGHDALLTPHVAQEGINRALDQPEDVPGPWTRLVRWVAHL